jgi:protein-S-isoprenylcysteine O-methyltransferase Ste14
MSVLINTFNRDLIRNHTKIVIIIWILKILGPVSGIMFTLFLFWGSFTLIDLGLSSVDGLLIDIFLSMMFFLQHSILLVMAFWQKSATLVANADGIIFWILRALFFLCLAGFFWGSKALGSFDALGVKPLMRYISNRQSKPQQIVAKGPYRWSRHPLYLFVIILIWSCPVLTLDRLIFNMMWTIWIIVGTFLEDRDLHREFGSQYREYSSRVPMLIPYRIPKNKSVR